MKELFLAIIKRRDLLLFVPGLALLVLSVVKSIPVGGGGVIAIENPYARLVVGLIGVLLAGLGLREILKLGTTRHDVFLAYPMASLAPEHFDEAMTFALKLIQGLINHAGVKSVYFAGQKITSVGGFEAHDIAAEVDLAEIGRAKSFFMVLPQSMVSSVLFEAGYALAKGKPSVYFVKRTADLPYLMRRADALPRPPFPAVKVYTYESDDALLRLIEINGKNLLHLPSGHAADAQ